MARVVLPEPVLPKMPQCRIHSFSLNAENAVGFFRIDHVTDGIVTVE